MWRHSYSKLVSFDYGPILLYLAGRGAVRTAEHRDSPALELCLDGEFENSCSVRLEDILRLLVTVSPQNTPDCAEPWWETGKYLVLLDYFCTTQYTQIKDRMENVELWKLYASYAQNKTQHALFAIQRAWFLAPAPVPTHVSLRTSASSSIKMVCVAVRYRVPTLLLLGDTRSSSLTFSTWKRKRMANMKVPLHPLDCRSDYRCSHVISALINTPCSQTRLLWPWLTTWPTGSTPLYQIYVFI